MEQLHDACIEMHDPDAGDSLVLVRAFPGAVILGLSVQKNGDIEIQMDIATCRRVSQAIAHALTLAESAQRSTEK